MKKGISALSLSITVVIMFILITVVTVSGISTYNTGLKMAFGVELSSIQVSVDAYHDKNLEYPIKRSIQVDLSSVSAKAKVQFSGENIVNDKIILSEIDYKLLGFNTLKYGVGKEGANDIYAVSETTGIVYYVKGLNLGNDTYYMLNEELSGLIKFENSDNNALNEDGIIFVADNNKWTNSNINVEVKIPKEYIVTNIKLGGDILNLTSTSNEMYNVYNVENIDSNKDIIISYTKDSESKTVKYEINNIDKVSPTLNISSEQKVMNTVENKYAYSSITSSDELSGIKVIKYENEQIGDNTSAGKQEIKSYFETNGKTIYNELLNIQPKVNKMTVYIEDFAGNWTVKYVTIDEEVVEALKSDKPKT